MPDILNTLLPWLLPIEIFIIGNIVIFTAQYFLIKKHRKIASEISIIRQALFFIIVLATVLVFIVSMPISETLRGQILSLFGIAFTAVIALSSTTFVGNAMAGSMLRMIDTIEPGDYIKILTHEGRVTEQRLLYTEIQTEDRDLITLPNLFLVNNPVEIVRTSGTIISSTVSLGYNVPRREVETQLLKAGQRIGLSDSFVQILELGNFSVTYRLAGMLEDTHHIISTHSKLRAAMLDTLHEANIEIVSPAFMNQIPLDPTQKIIPTVTEIDTTEFGTDDYEKLIFDKAHVAQVKEKLKTIIKKNETEIQLLKSQHEKAKDDNNVLIEKKIQKLEARTQRLKTNVDALDLEEME